MYGSFQVGGKFDTSKIQTWNSPQIQFFALGTQVALPYFCQQKTP